LHSMILLGNPPLHTRTRARTHALAGLIDSYCMERR